MQRERRLAGPEFGPPRRLEAQLQAEHVPMERDRLVHVGHEFHRVLELHRILSSVVPRHMLGWRPDEVNQPRGSTP